MSDFPYVGPPPGGLTTAMSTARRRRLRTAGTTSGLSAMSLLVVALLAGQTGRTTLVQGPTKETPAVTTEEKTVTKGRQTTVTVSDTSTFTVGIVPNRTPASPTGSAPAVPRGPAASGPISQRQTSALPRSVPYAAGPIQRNDNTVSISTCALDGDGKSNTVCPESGYSSSGGPANAPHQMSAGDLEYRRAAR